MNYESGNMKKIFGVTGYGKSRLNADKVENQEYVEIDTDIINLDEPLTKDQIVYHKELK
ncbi:hypothetical protein M3649_03935 [Ureibacillus chungkukjangi]|uniref:hypothetical protein n=1 Tax=Ureibacillus chungkukjangi TaxID=1202712 RepID=UPI00203E1E62|nr:hypothetical protein [Ureibacillus chungkukjangi]MCM3387282.1 hypothetical protein [Ureibacillus chungkukjangi]